MKARPAVRRREPGSQELLRLAFDHQPVAVAISYGDDLRVLMANPAYQTFAPGKPMVGHTMEEIWPELDPQVFATFRRVLATGEPFQAVDQLYRIARSPGGPLEDVWFTWTLQRFRLSGNAGWALLNTALETTQQKLASDQLKTSEAELRMLVNAFPQLCWMADGEGYIFWYNARWYEYTGTTPEQMRGWGWQSVHDSQLLPAIVERWRASIRSGQPFEMVFPLRGRDGNFRSFLTRIVPIHSESGKVVRWFGTNTDIDELRSAQDALRASEAKLRLQQERLRLTRTAAKVAPWEYDPLTQQFAWSVEAYELFDGVTLGDSLGDFLSLMRYSADREAAERLFMPATSHKGDYEFIFRHVGADGRVRLISTRGRSFYNHGEPILLGMFVDITPPTHDPGRRRKSPR